MRPKPVDVTTWLMAVLNILGYALLWNINKPRPVVVRSAINFTLMIVLGYVVIWFYWHGKNWARILVLLTSLSCLYNLRDLQSANLVVRFMLIGEAAVAVFLLYWLNTSEAKAYFKSNKTSVSER
jgi:hypothetical protein